MASFIADTFHLDNADEKSAEHEPESKVTNEETGMTIQSSFIGAFKLGEFEEVNPMVAARMFRIDIDGSIQPEPTLTWVKWKDLIKNKSVMITVNKMRAKPLDLK